MNMIFSEARCRLPGERSLARENGNVVSGRPAHMTRCCRVARVARARNLIHKRGGGGGRRAGVVFSLGRLFVIHAARRRDECGVRCGGNTLPGSLIPAFELKAIARRVCVHHTRAASQIALHN